MKMSGHAHAVYVLPLLLGCLMMAGACASTGGRAVEGANPVRVNRVNYRGWDDSLLMTNGDVVVVIVPQVARIMKYAFVDGENVLWVNDELAPERTGSPGTQGFTERWENFGGYKLWPAPEKVWGEPPPWELDRGACRVEITPQNSVRLIGMPSPDFGLRFDREITLAPEGSRLEIKQSAVNVSDRPITASVWDVTQLKPDCVAFVPMGPGAGYRAGTKETFEKQWRRAGSMMLLRPAGDYTKTFFTGPPGWLGCKRGEALYLKVFDIAETPPPRPETPREVYTAKDYIELEAVGPAVELQPDQSTTFTERWYLLRDDFRDDGDEKFARAVVKAVSKLFAAEAGARQARPQ